MPTIELENLTSQIATYSSAEDNTLTISADLVQVIDELKIIGFTIFQINRPEGMSIQAAINTDLCDKLLILSEELVEGARLATITFSPFLED